MVGDRPLAPGTIPDGSAQEGLPRGGVAHESAHRHQPPGGPQDDVPSRQSPGDRPRGEQAIQRLGKRKLMKGDRRRRLTFQ